MKTKDLQELNEKYPNLYKHYIHFDCHEGWYDLIDQLSSQLDELCREHVYCYPSQVKEKFGTLRFYMASETNEMSKLIEEAERKSAYICEICGKEGHMRSKFRWLYTRCDEHEDT